jgi:hypothetical protein
MHKRPRTKLSTLFALTLAGAVGAETPAVRAQNAVPVQAPPAAVAPSNPGPSNDDDPNLRRDRDIPEDRKLQSGFALGAFSTLRAKEVVYISEPITSGKRLYEFMDLKGYKSIEEAKQDADAFFKSVVAPNIAEGEKAANAWEGKTRGVVIATADFEKNVRGHKAQQWGQDDYMSMWISLVDKKVTHMVMVDGWQYSNGSGEEYLEAALMQMGDRDRANIKITDERGKTLHLHEGMKLLSDAFDDVRGRGLDCRNMAETLARLVVAEQRYAAEEVTLQAQGAVPAYRMQYDRKKADAVGDHVREVLKADFPDVLAVVEKTPTRDFSPLDDLFRMPAAAKPPAFNEKPPGL